ncbi:hypothetical protein BS50DRAFT_387542 [Corynespora cassiicola Philippines]|uniref:Uncharacterized protein n=1 Tax=Corynespora cassiicola Philippines TaxID=1448308 RepID=A0A2T2NPT0_CORCC|nr:hypothetical protein BS50DRAFT_387542 [Corynespora cassiicola Philippines]
MDDATTPRRHGHGPHAPAKGGANGGGGKNGGEENGTASHRRSISGSLLNSLSFLRSSSAREAPEPPPRPDDQDDEEEQHGEGAEGSRRGSALANALRQSQGRRRKGSLRKTAILGTKTMMRERRNSFLKERASSSTTTAAAARAPIINIDPHAQMPPASPAAAAAADDDDDDATPRRFSYENGPLNSSSDSGWPPQGKLSVSTMAGGSNNSIYGHEFDHTSLQHTTPRMLTSPITSPGGQYASTTDDDEALSFFRPSASSSSSYNAIQPASGSSLQRRRSTRAAQHSSLTIVQTSADLALDDEWDYSETEWWGWVVLVATWVVFVVGMGSCLGVWSWAWDVGETPYAPPELEDDPTLPITGYYPALMLCTAVMAWVWVVVAWVGMKYFRHAKVVGDDT